MTCIEDVRSGQLQQTKNDCGYRIGTGQTHNAFDLSDMMTWEEGSSETGQDARTSVFGHTTHILASKINQWSRLLNINDFYTDWL